LVIALRSLIRGPTLLSVRDVEVNKLIKTLNYIGGTQMYIVVTGQKGVGKTCLIDTALMYTCGVTKIDVTPDDHHNNIIDAALRNLTNMRFNFMDPRASAKRLVWWYNLVASQPPILVLNAKERSYNQGYANLVAPVRTLTEEFGLRVIVDGSPNSVPPGLLATKREIEFKITPMSKEMIAILPQLATFFQVLQKLGLVDAVWNVLGGYPSQYEILWHAVNRSLKRFGIPEDNVQDHPKELRTVIGKFLQNQIAIAIDELSKAINAAPQFKEILKLLNPNLTILKHDLNEKNLKRPSPDKIFRDVIQNDGNFILVPSTPALALVLYNKLGAVPSVEQVLMLRVPE